MTLILAALIFSGAAAAGNGAVPTEKYALLKTDVGDGLVCYVACVPKRKQQTLAALIRKTFPFEKIEDPDLVDAEKRTLIPDQEDEDCDSMLCWAASISNTLWMTGWGEHMTNPLSGRSFTSEDDIFQYFVKSFYDGGNNMDFGLQWIFDGVSRSENPPGFGWAHLKRDPSRSDALLPRYSARDLITVTDVAGDYTEISALDSLTEGAPVNLSLEFCSRGSDEGTTHAVTAVGLIADLSAKTPEDRYRYILLANSDNSVEGYEDIPAWKRPDIYSCYPLRVRYNNAGEKVWEVVGYEEEGSSYTRVRTVYTLAPYGSAAAEAAAEKDPRATRNALDTVDLVLYQPFTGKEKDDRDAVSAFGGKGKVWLNFDIVNESYENCDQSFVTRVTVKRLPDGIPVSFQIECNANGELYSLETLKNSICLNDYMKLSGGTYSVLVEVNPARAPKRMTEAYYLNNTRPEITFTVKNDPPPKTGDPGAVILWIACAVTGLIGMAVILFSKKRSER